MNDSRRKSKWIDWIKNWKGVIICFVIFLACASIFFVTVITVKYPTEKYDTYIEVQEDGFEYVNFFFSSRIEANMNKPVIIMKEAGMELLTDRYYPNGIYYKYSVVYRNGTILETEKEYIPLGVNRTLLDFDDIELSILQMFSGYTESSEGVAEKLPISVLSFFGALIFLISTVDAYCKADYSGYRHHRWRR